MVYYTHGRQILSALFISSLSLNSFAELNALSDDELSGVYGRSSIAVDQFIGDGISNGSAGVSFTRVTYGADIEINANIDRLVLGGGNNGPIDTTRGNGAGDGLGLAPVDPSQGAAADIAIDNLSLGSVNSATQALEALDITDPFIELAFENANDPDTRALVGIRIGAAGIEGDVSGVINAFSGDLNFTAPFNAVPTSVQTSQRRSNHATFTLATGEEVFLPLNQFNSFRLGEENNPAQNFFIGLQNRALDYPIQSTTAPQGTAQPGFWINLQDNINVGDGGSIFGAQPLPNRF